MRMLGLKIHASQSSSLYTKLIGARKHIWLKAVSTLKKKWQNGKYLSQTQVLQPEWQGTATISKWL